MCYINFHCHVQVLVLKCTGMCKCFGTFKCVAQALSCELSYVQALAPVARRRVQACALVAHWYT